MSDNNVNTAGTDGEEHLPEELLALIREAVAAYSPTYHEAPAIGVFERAAQWLGLRVRRVQVEDGRDNLVVEAGPQPPAIALVGHIDTIEGAGPAQAQAYVRDGSIYGLGTSDMKAACMTMLYAASQVLAEVAQERAAGGQHGAAGTDGLAKGFAIHLVVGEEEYGDGAQVALQELSAPLVVIGEPTGMRACLEHYSYYEAILRTTGSRVHAALPELGVNAISAMLDWLREISEASGGSDIIITNPRWIEGGSEQFLVPERCEAYVDIHTSAHADDTAVEQLLNTSASNARKAFPDCSFSHTREFFSAGFRQSASDPRLEPLRRTLAITGNEWQTAAFRSHSDAPMFFDHGIATVVCGPGNLAYAHTSDEHIELPQIAESVRFYAQLIRTTCVEGAIEEE